MKESKHHSRREFLKQLAFAGAGVVVAPSFLCALTEVPDSAKNASGKNTISETRPRPPGAKFVGELTTEPLETVRVGLIGLGQRGFGFSPQNASVPVERRGYWGLLGEILNVPFAQVVAVADRDFSRAEEAVRIGSRIRPNLPAPGIYAGTENAWKNLCERDDIDVVVVATPWNLHVPMALHAMNSGKHVFIEVPAAVSVDECWALADASELTQRHCVILENCCYGDEEMFVLNMVRHGVFGKLTHAECAYIHDLRAMLFREGTEGDWRREYHKSTDGNLYPTHGLGPVCRYFDVNRTDALDVLVSMSSREAGLSDFRTRGNAAGKRTPEKFSDEKYVCGDMNTTLIKTALGRTILLRHDVVSPQPYSRVNMLTGTEATFSGYPPRLALDIPEKYDVSALPGGANAWLGERDFSKMRNMFRDPLWRVHGERMRRFGHGGMDAMMCFRLLDCIRQGITPDITVYDAATWSSIVELSAHSVANGSVPVKIPDFRRRGNTDALEKS